MSEAKGITVESFISAATVIRGLPKVGSVDVVSFDISKGYGPEK